MNRRISRTGSGRRWTVVGAVLALLLTGSANGATATPTTAALEQSDWFATVSADLERREYQVREVDGRHRAFNRRHQLISHFTAEGLSLTMPDNPDTPQLGFRFRGLSRLGAMGEPLPPATAVVHEGQRAILRHGPVSEWYINGESGLEHGFDIAERPRGEGAVVLEVAISHARARQDGEGLRLTLPNGRQLHYDKLLVVDADGRELPARLMVADASTLRIRVDDRGARYPIVVDPLLTGAHDTRLAGDQVGAQLGYSVAGAGDVNGDGYDDVIVGAANYDNGENNEGAAFIYHGSATGIATTYATMLESDQIGASLGYSVAGAGDVNGDGYADVIVGAPDYDNGENNEGAAFVYHGSAAGIVATYVTMLESDQLEAELGRAVAGAGDVNGDGYADVIVGAPDYDNGENNEGAAFIYHGSVAGIDATYVTRLESNQPDAKLGFSVAEAGDVNGDGYADVIVGAPQYSNGQSEEGAAFIYHGSAAGIAATAVAMLESNQASSRLGTSVAGAGDVNGDGYADVIVGAQHHDNGESGEGAAFVYHGSAAGIATTYVTMLESDQPGASLGVAVAGVGDVNGDGYADVIVGAANYDNGENNEGAAFVYHGSAAGVITTYAALLESDQASAYMGSAVAGAGDVNGDGHADVIVGAMFYDNGGSDTGAAFVYHGSASGLSTAAAEVLERDQAGASLGYSVAGVGDINGDGYADVAVGAPYYENGALNEGAAFVYHGSASGLSTTPAVVLEGNQTSGRMGYSVAGAGDVNGDGYADVIVGMPSYINGDPNEGAAFVYHGSASGLSTTPAAVLEGNQAGAQKGTSVAGAGDVNGDGYADVIVGAPNYDKVEPSEGVAFVYHGSAGGLSTTPAAVLERDQANAAMGTAVAGAGDVNGDGYADVIVGAQFYENGESAEGAAFVYHGSAGGLSTTPAAVLEGNQTSGRMGYSVAGAGDVNGDGYADVIVGAPYYDNSHAVEGAAFVYHGSASGLSTTAAAVLAGNQILARLGTSVAGAGDVNGDGYADVIVGAESYDNGEDDEGAAFVYHGSASGLSTTPVAVLEGNQAYAQMGFSVAGAGDVNGDGYADVVVGADRYDNGENNEGAAFVHYGNGGRTGLNRHLAAFTADGSDRLIASGGVSLHPTQVKLRFNPQAPVGRAKVKLEFQACPSGVAFGHADCVDGSASGENMGPAPLTHTLTGLSPGSLYRWRVRGVPADDESARWASPWFQGGAFRTAGNTPPAISGSPTTTVNQGQAYGFTPAATDADGDTLTFSVANKPGWLSFNPATGTLAGTPTAADVGSYPAITLSVSDGFNTVSLPAFTLTVVAVNAAPVLTGVPVDSVLAGKSYRFQPLAHDPDGDALSFSIVNKPAWASFSASTGALTGTPTPAHIGKTSGIVIRVSDGVYTASLPPFAITVVADLDGDGVADDIDPDIDGDGIPNDVELAFGLDPYNPADALGDLDGDGVSNLQEYLDGTDLSVDDHPPVVTSPADLTVGATGRLTRVSLGEATAYDHLDGDLPATADTGEVFVPGRHVVTWSATDAAGNTGSAEQIVQVLPQVALPVSQTVAEGSRATIRFYLNGEAPSYPVLVPYTISGTAAYGEDHTLAAGTVSIHSGTEAELLVDLLADAVSEGTETLVVTLGEPVGAVRGPLATHTVFIAEANVAPRVTLLAEQAFAPTIVVGQDGGPLLITATVSDPNPGDSHAFEWRLSDPAAVDLDADPRTVTLDAALLAQGPLEAWVKATDAGGLSGEHLLRLQVVPSLPVLGPEDSDGDGIPDQIEGTGDADGDGLPDYLDPYAGPVLPAKASEPHHHLLETEPGIALRLGSAAVALGIADAELEGALLLAHYQTAADDRLNVGGYFDFELTGLEAGASVRVVVPQRAAIPAGAVYRKLIEGDWRDFVTDAANAVASAPGEAGICPPPGDSAYQPGLSEGHWCVQLTLQDGGPNDADGAANGTVADPGGVAADVAETPEPEPAPEPPRRGGGGALGWYALLLLGWMVALRRRPHCASP